MAKGYTRICKDILLKNKTNSPGLKWNVLLVLLFLLRPTFLKAQENYEIPMAAPDPLMQLMSRMGDLEAENRELRGQLEETQHELSILHKQMDSLSADIDYRLNNPESDSMPLPLPPSSPVMDRDNKINRSSTDPEEDYEKARSFLEQGDYEAAERAFAAFMATYPKEKLAGAAQYWLGVTYFVRGLHEKAVAAFAKGYKNYPKSPKAAPNLLKLVQSLAALDRIADACTTLDQLSSEHPQALANEVAGERKKLNCK
jgi:tol-pal system protein YbgF